MSDIGLEMLGLAAILKILDNVKEETIRKTERGLHKVGNEIMDESVPITPILTGNLRSSALPPKTMKKDETEIVVSVGYGEYQTRPGYFLYVHERSDLYHEPPTQSKFLEEPAKKMQQKISKIIDTELNG